MGLADAGDFEAAEAAVREFAHNIDPQAISTCGPSDGAVTFT